MADKTTIIIDSSDLEEVEGLLQNIGIFYETKGA